MRSRHIGTCAYSKRCLYGGTFSIGDDIGWTRRGARAEYHIQCALRLGPLQASTEIWTLCPAARLDRWADSYLRELRIFSAERSAETDSGFRVQRYPRAGTAAIRTSESESLRTAREWSVREPGQVCVFDPDGNLVTAWENGIRVFDCEWLNLAPPVLRDAVKKLRRK